MAHVETRACVAPYRADDYSLLDHMDGFPRDWAALRAKADEDARVRQVAEGYDRLFNDIQNGPADEYQERRGTSLVILAVVGFLAGLGAVLWFIIAITWLFS